jgi:stage II sporulation protein AA (anti-sigma F factor antagonist)
MALELPDIGRRGNTEIQRRSPNATWDAVLGACGALSVKTFADGDALILALAGELDLATVDLVCEALDEVHAHHPSRLVIDFSGLSFIDTSGLAVIVAEARRDRSDGEPRLELRPGPRQVQRLFAVAGVLHRLPFVEVS